VQGRQQDNRNVKGRVSRGKFGTYLFKAVAGDAKMVGSFVLGEAQMKVSSGRSKSKKAGREVFGNERNTNLEKKREEI